MVLGIRWRRRRRRSAMGGEYSNLLLSSNGMLVLAAFVQFRNGCVISWNRMMGDEWYRHSVLLIRIENRITTCLLNKFIILLLHMYRDKSAAISFCVASFLQLILDVASLFIYLSLIAYRCCLVCFLLYQLLKAWIKRTYSSINNPAARSMTFVKSNLTPGYIVGLSPHL